MILITGATGTVGRDVVRILTERGAQVRAMTRAPETAKQLAGFANVELAYGDAAKPETLDAAFQGVEKVMLITAAALDWDDQHRNVIAAAQRNHVQHLVKLSTIGASLEAPSFMMSAHARGEKLIEESGLPFTHLRPHVFFQNFVTFFAASIKASGVFHQCTNNQPLAQIDTRDIAEVAATVLTQAGHAGKAYELTGPEALSYGAAAERLSAVVGRSIRYLDVPPAAFAQAMIAAGVPAFIAEEAVNIYARGYLADGRGSRTTDTMRQITGRAPRSIEDFARDYAAALA